MDDAPPPPEGPPRRPARRPARRLARWVLATAFLLILLALAGAAAVYVQVRRSLPMVDGRLTVPGLGADVVVDRDALGVPTISGATRADVARATGFVHAQDRFFQMDVLRRVAAGELGALVGPAGLAVDRQTRVHRMRVRAGRALELAGDEERALIAAYAAGVNAGLASLGAAPFEYLMLRTSPQPWRPEDSALVVAAMFFDLQDADGEHERRMERLHQALPAALVDFLTTRSSVWDTPLVGDAFGPPFVPGPEVFDVHRADAIAPSTAALESDSLARPIPARVRLLRPHAWLLPDRLAREWPNRRIAEEAAGSNNWAVAGTHTASGAAIVASDMHLGLSVPNIWYRASLTWARDDPSWPVVRVTGVTLPGVPALVAGSNERIAWAFTNTEGDWTDLIPLELEAGNGARYLTADGYRDVVVHHERLDVKGGATEILDVRETIWGPVIGDDAKGRPTAVRWVAHLDGAINLHMLRAETTVSVEAALDLAPDAGVPAQNFVIGDREGRIGWTVSGRIPRRVGFDGSLPVSWTDGRRKWDGWLTPAEYPRLLNPGTGRLVTANNRLAGGTALGAGRFDPGARARQIRDALVKIERATPRDMLPVQLDDRALLLDRWRGVALQALATGDGAATEGRREFKRLLASSWSGRASIESVGYRLVRDFRRRVTELVFAPFEARLHLPPPPAGSGTPGTGLALQVAGIEGAVWQLLHERPAHLLAPSYPSWDALLLTAIDDVVRTLTADGHALASRTWGEWNTVRIGHPLSGAVPFAGRWLDMPADQLPGDSNLPRVQGPRFGASERFAVTPGREGDGYYHMATGQSGHPMSSHYRDGHGAWVRGEPTPFMPGASVYRLTLTAK